MTGAAQTSSTTSILRRPRTVRWASSANASCGTGSVWTVNPSGSSSMLGPPARGDELEPAIKDCDQGAQGPPLKGVAVVFFHAAADRRPVAQQPVGRRAGLLHGPIQKVQL